MAPGTSCTSRTKLRPFTGRSCTAFSVTSALSVDESVCTSGDSATTVTFSDTAPTCSFDVEARAIAGREDRRVAVCVVNPCSSIFTV